MAGMGYENSRVNFDRIVRLYNDYCALYKGVSGSLAGITPFGEFYWQMTYYSKYQDRRIGQNGF